MKRVVMLREGKTVAVNDSYAARLVEQGRAVIAPEGKKKPTRKESAKAVGDA